MYVCMLYAVCCMLYAVVHKSTTRHTGTTQYDYEIRIYLILVLNTSTHYWKILYCVLNIKMTICALFVKSGLQLQKIKLQT
jgi:hypothetical protein